MIFGADDLSSLPGDDAIVRWGGWNADLMARTDSAHHSVKSFRFEVVEGLRVLMKSRLDVRLSDEHCFMGFGSLTFLTIPQFLKGYDSCHLAQEVGAPLR